MSGHGPDFLFVVIRTGGRLLARGSVGAVAFAALPVRAVRMDAGAKVSRSPEYQLAARDLQAWERRNGPNPEAGKYRIENLTNLDRLPTKGAKLVIAPIRVEAASAPARVIAILP